MLCGYKGLDAGCALPSRATPNPTSPVLLPRRRQKGFSGEHQLFSKLTEWEETLSPPIPSPLSSRYALTSLTPTFFPSQFPPLSLVGWSFQPTLQQKRQRRQGYFPFPPHSPTPWRKEGCRPEGPPFLKMHRASAAKSADVQNS